jgi:hypothetical protein
MKSQHVLIPLLLVPFALAGCGAAKATDGGSTSPAPGGITHPTGSHEVVIRVTNGGGFVALEYNLREVPQFTLYGDGTVIVPGAVDMKYPGPAIYPLQTFKQSEPEIQALLTAATTAGLLDQPAPDYGDMGAVGISDAPTTTLVLNADGRTSTREAYALGMGTGARLTAAQAQARKALAGFIADLPQGADAGAYTPSGLAVYVAPYQGDPQMDGKPVVWPLGDDLATSGKKVSDGLDHRCIAVEGEDTQTLLAALGKANELTQWLPRENADSAYRLTVKPLLPGEVGCST